MEEKEDKKEIKLSLGTAVLLIILIIFLAILLSMKIITKDKRINSNYEKNEKAITELNISDIEEILNNSKNITSYKCKYSTFNNQEITEIYKNNKSVIESKNENNKNFTYYKDYDNEKNDIALSKEDNLAIKGYGLITNANILKNRQKELLQLLQNIEETDLTIIGNDTFDNKNCIVIEIKQIYNNDGWSFGEDLSKYNGKDMVYKIWIDYETGAMLKTEFKCEDKEYSFEYKYEFNCVTDEEVKWPDLTEYRVVEK